MALMIIDGDKENACRLAEANAIRGKTGTSSSISYDFQNNKGFADIISSIPTGAIIGVQIESSCGGITPLRQVTGGLASLDTPIINSNTIIYSRNINDYQEVEYIESTGTQYIDTNVCLSTNAKIEFDGIIIQNELKNYEALFGARKGNYSTNAYVFFTRFNAQDVPCYGRTGNETSGSDLIYNSRITLTTENNIATWTDGTNTYSVTTSGTINQCVNPLLIFDLNNSSSNNTTVPDNSNSLVKLYSFKIYESNILIRNFMPCYSKISGEIGLFDKINNQFYTNYGSGVFNKGNDVNS